jgi:hypothetical protein
MAIGCLSYWQGPRFLASPMFSAALCAVSMVRATAHGALITVTEHQGAPAYTGWSPEQICSIVLSGARPPLPEGLHPGVARTIAECWAHDPAARPALSTVLLRLECILQALLAPSLGSGSSSSTAPAHSPLGARPAVQVAGEQGRLGRHGGSSRPPSYGHHDESETTLVGGQYWQI